MQKSIIPYGKQCITPEDLEAVKTTLLSDFLTTGPKVKEFEDAFAQYIGATYAVAVANGTAALHLCALALEVNEKSKIITTPITFAASSNCIRYCNGTVEFGDVDPETVLLSLNSVRAILEKAPKGTYQGIIPVDFAGYPVNLEGFSALADEFGLWIIEDACHAPGGWFTDSNGIQQKCGNGQYADLAIFSFHPVKHIACGEGGMITTNNPDLYERLMALRTHGIIKNHDTITKGGGGWAYDMIALGYNYRLTDFQSALGISQLKRADTGLERRRTIAKRYDEAFANTAIKTINPPTDIGHAYHLYVIQVERRKELYDYLRTQGIYAQIHYIPTHTLSYYQNLGYKDVKLPLAEAYYDHCISLPMYPSLSDEEQEFVIEKVMNFYQN